MLTDPEQLRQLGARFAETPGSDVHLRRGRVHSSFHRRGCAGFALLSDFSAPVVAFDVRVGRRRAL